MSTLHDQKKSGLDRSEVRAQVHGRPPGRGRDFALVLTGQAVSMQGDGLAGLALIWWIADETGSVGVATLLTLLTMLPVILLGPVAGVLVDRYSRRALMMIADLVRAATALVLAWQMASGNFRMGVLLAAATVSAACRAFHRPALQASIVQLVPAEGLNRANSLFQLAEGAANLIAPAVSGALVAWLGAGPVMGISAATCVFAALTLLFAAIPPLPAKPAASHGGAGFLREMTEGLSYLWTGQRMLFFTLCTFALVNFAMVPVGPLIPFIAQERMGVDSSGLGLLMSGLSAGTVAGALAMSVAGSRVRRGFAIIWGIAGTGLMLAILSQLRSAVAGLGAMALMGAAVSVVNVCSSGLFQAYVPKEMQGRVFAVRSSVSAAASPLSLALVGAVSSLLAPHTMLLIGGVIVVAGGLIGYAVPGLASAE